MLQVSKDPDEEQKEYDPPPHTHVHTPFFTFPMLANEYKPIPGRDTERCLGGVVQCRHWNGGEAPGSLLLPLNLGPTSTLSGQSSFKKATEQMPLRISPWPLWNSIRAFRQVSS